MLLRCQTNATVMTMIMTMITGHLDKEVTMRRFEKAALATAFVLTLYLSHCSASQSLTEEYNIARVTARVDGLVQRGEFDTAITELHQLLDNSDNNSTPFLLARLNLGGLYEKVGNYEKARDITVGLLSRMQKFHLSEKYIEDKARARVKSLEEQINAQH
jgi:tetratricopeptide (TPR) repeat protein